MQFNQEVIVYGLKASKGTFEGRDFDTTTFHVEADLKANAAGKSLGRVTTPMKFGDSTELDKWEHLAKHFPIKAQATFDVQANGKGETNLVLLGIKPAAQSKAA